MLLEVPVLYRVSGYTKTGRVLIRGNEVTMAAIRVPEVDPADAPVVGRCAFLSYARQAGGFRGTQGVSTEIEYRVVDGRLLRPMTVETATFAELDRASMSDLIQPGLDRALETGGGTCMVTAGLARDAMELLHANVFLDHGLRAPVATREPRHHVTRVSKPGGEVKRLEASDIETRKRAWEGTAMIGGVLHVPSWGPGWKGRKGSAVAEAVPEMALLQGYSYSCGGLADPSELPCLVGMPKLFGHVELDADAPAVAPFDVPVRSMLRAMLAHPVRDWTPSTMSPRGLRAMADVLELRPEEQLDKASAGMLVQALHDGMKEGGFADPEAGYWLEGFFGRLGPKPVAADAHSPAPGR